MEINFIFSIGSNNKFISWSIFYFLSFNIYYDYNILYIQTILRNNLLLLSV